MVGRTSLVVECLSVRIPGGSVAVVADPLDGAVIASGFADIARAIGFLDEPTRQRGHRIVRSSQSLEPARQALLAYSEGNLLALDHVRVRQHGGEFTQRAWLAMREIRPGDTDSYSGLAARAGSPRAARAAGRACARNRVSPFVPCHRIIATDGSLGGFAYGLSVKTELLLHESAFG